jgi:hypothetical protein
VPFGKFAYDSKSGKLSVALKCLDLTGKLAATEDHFERGSADQQQAVLHWHHGVCAKGGIIFNKDAVKIVYPLGHVG